MQPLPEVRAAAEALSHLTGELDLLHGLEVVAEAAAALVPSLVGVSLTIVVDDEPFTVTATEADTAAVDAVQYLEDGPCLSAAGGQDTVLVADVLDEERWRLYRHAASASGVRSSLSLPLGGAGGQTPGAINFYASEPHAFRGRESLLAEAFQTPADAFVTNADLTFSTREAARQLPERIEEKAKVDQAAGVLSALLGWSPDDAGRRLRDAAGRAGTPVAKVADVLVLMAASR